MNTTKIAMALGLAAFLTIVTFFQLKKKEEFTIGKLILTCVITFVLCAAVGYGVGLLMDNINFFGN